MKSKTLLPSQEGLLAHQSIHPSIHFQLLHSTLEAHKHTGEHGATTIRPLSTPHPSPFVGVSDNDEWDCTRWAPRAGELFLTPNQGLLLLVCYKFSSEKQCENYGLGERTLTNFKIKANQTNFASSGNLVFVIYKLNNKFI